MYTTNERLRYKTEKLTENFDDELDTNFHFPFDESNKNPQSCGFQNTKKKFLKARTVYFKWF